MSNISRFENLSDSQRQELISWFDKITYDRILERLALPPPEGFDFQTSRASLSRFRQRVQLQDFLEHQDDNSTQAVSIVEAAGDPQVIEDASLALLRQRLFSAAV